MVVGFSLGRAGFPSSARLRSRIGHPTLRTDHRAIDLCFWTPWILDVRARRKMSPVRFTSIDVFQRHQPFDSPYSSTPIAKWALRRRRR